MVAVDNFSGYLRVELKIRYSYKVKVVIKE